MSCTLYVYTNVYSNDFLVYYKRRAFTQKHIYIKSLFFFFIFFFYHYFFFEILRQLYFRHPHGSFAQRALTHVGEGVIMSFITSPILCLPTYFIFRIKKTEITENETTFLLYHLDAKHDTGLYRYGVYCYKFYLIILI